MDKNSNNNRDAVLVAYGRSPMCRANKGAFSKMHPVEYGAQTLEGVLNKIPELNRDSIDDVIVGCANPEKECFFNIGRLIAQRAGLSDHVPAQTINRFCSSGLQAIACAANAIMADQMDIVVAGGIEKMSHMNLNPDLQYADKKLIDMKPFTYIGMGLTAENIAVQYNISREEMEQMAFESHIKAASAQKKGKFNNEIIPVQVELDGEIITVTEDDGIRPNISKEQMQKLNPCFMENGTVTAATSSQMTDGAAFVVLMAREKAIKLGLRPIARFAGFAVAGVAAEVMGLGPIEAVPKVMDKTGLTIKDMDVIELNEAFASQAIACIRELQLPVQRVNPNGGAIALGHPMGATGAFLSCKAINELQCSGGKYALITMCIGGGMGAAGIWEMEQ